MGDSINIEALPFEEALAAYQQAYQKLFAILSDYPEGLQTESGVCGTWSPQQVVMHLSGWLIEAQRRFKRYPATGDIQYNVDVFNDVSLWDREKQTWERSVEELQREHQKLLEIAQGLNDYQIERDGRYAEWLTMMTQEAQTHGTALAAFSS